MARNERDKRIAPVREEDVAVDNKCTGPRLTERGEGCFEIALGCRFQNNDLNSDCAGRLPYRRRIALGASVALPEDAIMKSG
jgi:hypothetical protein